METVAATRKLTFKDVHAELEKESMLLAKEHDYKDFATKGSFLERIGFTNSIATRLYLGVAGSSNLVKTYMHKYGVYAKFILLPQLERVCERYNLYVRPLEQFIGDIPEKNVRDLMNFKVDIKDLNYEEDVLTRIIEETRQYGRYDENNFYMSVYGENTMHNMEDLLNRLNGMSRNNVSPFSIAAIKPLFSEAAFSETDARIIKVKEIEAPAKGQVDLDPIVLCEVKGGYLIITAWGDEANDELVANQVSN